LIRAGLILCGDQLDPIPDGSLIVEEGRVVEVRKQAVRGSFETVHDLAGKVVLPGLIDCHAHLQFTPQADHEAGRNCFASDQRSGLLPLRALHHAELALAAGLTTIRDCGSDLSLLDLRTAIQAGLPGPRVLVAGNPLTTTGGHCHWVGVRADSEEELRNETARLIEHGVDFIKVMASGGNMTAGSNPLQPQYSAAELAVVVAEAHRRGLRVVAHALNVEAIRNCVDAGVDSIDHCSWLLADGTLRYDDALGARMAATGVRVGLTGSGIRRVLLEQGDEGQRLLRAELDGTRRLLAAGVRVNVHSDAGVRFTYFDRFDQSLGVMVAGLRVSPRHALRAVTAVAAEAVGLGDEIGTINVGKRADLLVLDADPTEDIRNIRFVHSVFRDGRRLVCRGRMAGPDRAAEAPAA
jgi:imidazolonepropionase-like amidohydrolase